MGRYWLSLLLAVVAAGGIGGYYAYTASDRLPEFALVALEGDPALAEGVQLQGHLGGRFRSQSLRVDSEGSVYVADGSIAVREVAQARGWLTSRPGIKRLIREHRSFMRGKGNPHGLYMDDEWLVYADAVSEREHRLRIEALHLATGETKRRTWDVPEQPGLFYPRVVDVQRTGNVVRVVSSYSGAEHALAPYSPSQATIVSAVDLTGAAPPSAEKLAFGIELPRDADVGSIASETYARSEHIVFQIRGGAESGAPSADGAAFAYSYADGTLKRMSAEVEQALADVWVREMDGSRVTTLQLKEDRRVAAWATVDVVADAVVAARTIDAAALGADEFLSMALRDGRVYLLLRQGDAEQVAILDAADATVLYRGEVRLMRASERDADALSRVMLNNLYLEDEE